MPCICCFFHNEYQKSLKVSTFGEKSFLNKMIKYKEIYLSRFDKIQNPEECGCDESVKYNMNSGMKEYLAIVTVNIVMRRDYVEELFKNIIDIYDTYSSNDDKVSAFNKMDAYFKTCTNYSSNNSMQFTNVLFRGRVMEKKNDEMEYFHLPFPNSKDIEGQRFSIPGEPMLYLSRSLSTVLNELNSEDSLVNFAVFMPIYSYFYRSGMYNIIDSIESSLNAIFYLNNESFNEDFDNNRSTFSSRNLNFILGDSVLFHMMTFPLENSLETKEEYVLSQMFTRFLKKRGYVGLVYKTSKYQQDIKLGIEHDYDNNYCFFYRI